MTKTIGAEAYVERKLSKKEKKEKKAAQAKREENEAYEKRQRLIARVRASAAKYKGMGFKAARSTLYSTLSKSESLTLLFVARYLGMGAHREQLADLLRVEFAVACYAGDHKRAKRTQEALGALLLCLQLRACRSAAHDDRAVRGTIEGDGLFGRVLCHASSRTILNHPEQFLM